MENLEFKLTVAQANTILKYLGTGVYSEVVELINLLHNQAKSQIEATTASVVDEQSAQ